MPDIPGKNTVTEILLSFLSSHPVIVLQNHLLTDYEAAKKIEKQLLLVRNQTIEEFDAFFESHVMELKDRVFKDKPREDQILPDHIYDQEELIIEKLDMQVIWWWWWLF